MSSVEERLKEQLFPKKSLTGESVEKDILNPLNKLSSDINEIREKVAVTMLREAVELASDVKVAEGLSDFKLRLVEIRELQRGFQGVADVLDGVSMKVDELTSKVEAYIVGAGEVADLEASTLLKLNAHLDSLR